MNQKFKVNESILNDVKAYNAEGKKLSIELNKIDRQIRLNKDKMWDMIKNKMPEVDTNIPIRLDTETWEIEVMEHPPIIGGSVSDLMRNLFGD